MQESGNFEILNKKIYKKAAIEKDCGFISF